jgi:hypothetical protein
MKVIKDMLKDYESRRHKDCNPDKLGGGGV